ncbi:MAG TPA: M14 metallopeptidase family protein [Blastocatellia bacterium]|nr:M14 metallopeptidase family protein [Blastocatellia bacterium]
MHLTYSILVCRRLVIAIFILSALVPCAGAHSSVLADQRARKATAAANGNVTAPRDVLGFTPGDDRKLASWAQMVDYFKRLDRESNRVMVEELGKTTLGRPFLLATISSPANLARLDYYKEIQRKLADPRLINSNDAEAEKLIAEGKTIVLITCGIHSTEVGGNLVSMNIAHRLASDDSAETREILDRCIVLLVPSLNPDGVDIVKDWYDRSINTPAEGTSPPELYHHYTGHDNNRDWYAFTQVETRMTVDKVHNAWHPQIVHDIHQQGETGSRFFIPPYVEPWEPNVPPIIQAGVNFMGTTMAWEMTAEGKAGVVINGVYDAWTPARAYQHYHAGIRILSETASARIASPTTVPFEKLTPQVNVDTKVRSWNYPLVWQGGEWKLANIVDYMQSGAFALMRNSARYRERWLRDFYRVGKDAVRERKPGEPFAFVIPAISDGNEWRRDGLNRLTSILTRGGVEITVAASAFTADGRQYPVGTLVVPMAQPYGAFAKTLLERQQYPDLREYPGGPPRRPYDVTAHTLTLLMGVEAVQVSNPFTLPQRRYDASRPNSGAEIPTKRVGLYKSHAASMDEGWTRWILDQYKVKYTSLSDKEIRGGDLRAKYDCIIFPAQGSQSILNGLSRERYPAEISGGVGRGGVTALNRFMEDGGTIITFNEASNFAIAHLNVPVKNVLEGVAAKDFYCPGSILKIQFNANDGMTRNAPTLGSTPGESVAWFETGPAFETTGDGARVVARFAGAKDLLLSGWLLGAEKIANKGAIVEAKRGAGRVVMFAFRPQYRGQSIATLPFFFNAIQAGAQ